MFVNACVCDLRGLLLIGDLSCNEFINELVIKHEILQSRQSRPSIEIRIFRTTGESFTLYKTIAFQQDLYEPFRRNKLILIAHDALRYYELRKAAALVVSGFNSRFSVIIFHRLGFRISPKFYSNTRLEEYDDPHKFLLTNNTYVQFHVCTGKYFRHSRA